MSTTNDAVLLVDWLNLNIHVKERGFAFGADLVSDLIALAEKQCAVDGGVRLARAHFVAERFSAEVKAAITANLVAEVNETRTAKEQADLKLAVLAMDHLHGDRGTPRLFLLATGDQDFVPLIERMVKAESRVVLIVASTRGLAPDYLEIAAQSGVSLVALTDSIALAPIPATAPEDSDRVVLGLLRLCLNRGVLGGDQTRNIGLMTEWGVFPDPGQAEVAMAGAVKQFARVDHRTVAHPGKNSNGNHSRTAKRTSLNFADAAVIRAVTDADWVLRRIGPPGSGMNRGKLGVGRFSADDGRALDRTLTSLAAVGWLVERPDGSFETPFPHASDGILEPLWRVVGEINRRAYEDRTEGVFREKLFNDLRNGTIAHDSARRGGPVAREAIECAKRIGIIDTVLAPPDGFRLSVVESHPICRQVADFVRVLARLVDDDPSGLTPEHELLRRMQEHDERAGVSLFGHDARDRQRVLRMLRRCRLVDRVGTGDPSAGIRLKKTAWLRALVPS